MKQASYLLVIFLLHGFYLKAQDSTKAQIPTSFYIQLDGSLGLLRNDNTSFNKSLTNAGLRSFEENIFHRSAFIKFGFNKPFISRFIFGLGASKYGVQSTYSQTPPNYQINGVAFDLSLGYTILSRNDFNVYPYVGININSSVLTVIESDTTSIKSLADIVNTSQNTGTITFENKALDLGMCAERVFKSRTIDGCPKNVRYFSIGIKAGYLLKLQSENNAYHHGKIINEGANFGLNGPYVKLTFGYGIRFRKVKWT